MQLCLYNHLLNVHWLACNMSLSPHSHAQWEVLLGKIPLSEYHAAVGKKPIVTWYFTVPEMVNGHFTGYQIWYSTVCGLVFYWFTHGIIGPLNARMEPSDGSPLFHANFWSEPSDFYPNLGLKTSQNPLETSDV